MAGISGCDAKPSETPKSNKPAAESVESPEKEVELSQSEQRYAEYLKTLSPEQVALRESLNPDALAVMSEAQMTEAFTIKADEVTIDGKIDPKLYAEAFTARTQAMSNSGISKIEYEKWGGLDSFGLNTIEKVSEEYFNVQSVALLGYIGDKELTYLSLIKGSSVDRIIKSGLQPQPKERYYFRITANLESSTVIDNGDGTYDIRFTTSTSDNWEKDTMYNQSAVSIEPTEGGSTWDIKGLYITEQGDVLPGSLTGN